VKPADAAARASKFTVTVEGWKSGIGRRPTRADNHPTFGTPPTDVFVFLSPSREGEEALHLAAVIAEACINARL
jgi:hypothetical protein